MNTYGMITNIKAVLDELDLHYEHDTENNVIIFSVKISSKLKSLRYFVQIRETDYIVYAVCPICADEESRTEVMRYINRVNWLLARGNFEMDSSDGQVRFRYYVDCEDLGSISKTIVARSIITPNNVFEEYGNGIAALMMGFSDAETEFEKTEHK